jgi:hypothetical protein|eukprot:scaffold69_cov198-Alexandrium_tamarense.AAC.92
MISFLLSHYFISVLVHQQEAEKLANIARNKAAQAKKDFKAAKADACATRPGGKLLCLRGFGVGY